MNKVMEAVRVGLLAREYLRSSKPEKITDAESLAAAQEKIVRDLKRINELR